MRPQRDLQWKLLCLLSPQQDDLTAEDEMTLPMISALSQCQVRGCELIFELCPEGSRACHQSCLQIVDPPGDDMHEEVLVGGERLVVHIRTSICCVCCQRRLRLFGAGLRSGRLGGLDFARPARPTLCSAAPSGELAVFAPAPASPCFSSLLIAHVASVVRPRSAGSGARGPHPCKD